MTARQAMCKAIDAAKVGRFDEAECWRSISTELRQFHRSRAASDDEGVDIETLEQRMLKDFDPDA